MISVFVPSATAGTAGTGIILAAVSKNGSNCWYAVDNTVQQTATDVPYANLSGYTPNASAPGTFYGVQKNAATASRHRLAAIGPAEQRLPGQRIPSDAVA